MARRRGHRRTRGGGRGGQSSVPGRRGSTVLGVEGGAKEVRPAAGSSGGGARCKLVGGLELPEVRGGQQARSSGVVGVKTLAYLRFLRGAGGNVCRSAQAIDIIRSNHTALCRLCVKNTARSWAGAEKCFSSAAKLETAVRRNIFLSRSYTTL